VRRPDFIARQSSHPSGLLGRVIAWIMARETAAQNASVRQLLELAPTGRVLELGFGPGHNLAELARAVPEGAVAGVDHSEQMLNLATSHCRALIERGLVSLACADSRQLPYPDGRFDKALAVHTLYFWTDPLEHLGEVRRVLCPGGRFVLGFRPREDPASASFPDSVYHFHTRGDVERMLAASGFEKVVVHASSPSFMAVCAERCS